MNNSSTRTTIYDQEYFSGSQVNLYIGDVLVDEVVFIDFRVTETKRVWYGYASQLYDAVSKGTVIVEGQLSINYKESGYLHRVLERYRKLIGQSKKKLLFPVKAGGARTGDQQFRLKRNNIETQEFVDSVSDRTGKEPLTPEQQQQFFQALSGFNNPDTRVNVAGALGTAEDIFERFEDKIWGDEVDDKEARMITHETLNDFNIVITYGDFNRTDRVNHTVQEIQGIQLISQGQQVKIDGDNIIESYSFLARNII